MRKNGIDRTLTPIEGGVCAPSGFLANGVYCGFIKREDRREDLALIVAKKRCAVAGVFTKEGLHSAPVTLSKKRLQKGVARAIVVNSGIAVVFDGERLAERVCLEVEKYAKIPKEEILIASTGLIGKNLSIESFSKGMKPLVEGLESTNEKSLACARAIMTTDKAVKQLSFSFDLGGYTCKIGAIFKGGKNVCPNMATTLCLITTDVRISSQALQKALSGAVRDSFNLLNVDGNASPNDSVFILANGEAGNYLIDQEDSEYKKFAYILGEFLNRVCRSLAIDGDLERTLFICQVKGLRSKQTARALCKSVVDSDGIKKDLGNYIVDVQRVICAIHSAGECVSLEKTTISVSSEKGSLILFEEGKLLPVSAGLEKSTLQAREITITVDFSDGNFSAGAISIV